MRRKVRVLNCSIPPVVEAYLTEIESGTYPVNKRRLAFARLVRKTFAEEYLTVEGGRLEKYLSLERYFPFRLFSWEKCLIALWLCVYDVNGFPRWDTLFAMGGRGMGKDGLISFAALCLTSPYNPAREYDVDICANNEDQAIRPVIDLANILENGPERKKLERFFYHTKEMVKGRTNGGIIRGRTNNPGGKDGMRSGVVIYNEVHAYQDYANINVFETGLGKKADPRTGIFTSNGKVFDGPLDDYLGRADRILFEGEPDDGFLPFIACLDASEEVDTPENWHKANPSLKDMPTLMHTIQKEYRRWKEEPDNHADFLTKRMGIRAGAAEIAVTDYENILATKIDLPDMRGWSCIVGVDYAELNDWAAVNLHFKWGDERFDLCHAWICTKSPTIGRIKPNWKKWVGMGLLTPIDEPTISPEILAEYVKEAATQYNIVSLAMDHFRWTLVSEAFIKAGFDPKDKSRVKLIRPSDIMMIEPVIQDCFTRRLFRWGDNPALRWCTNNTKRVRSSRKTGSDTGNFYYAKIEAKSRKTDMFMALVASMCDEAKLNSFGAPELPDFGAITL